MTRPRAASVAVVLVVAAALAIASCSDGDGGIESSALCRAYDRVVAADDPHEIEQGMSTERVRAIARQQIPELRDLAEATDGRLRSDVEAELEYRQRFAARLLERWAVDDGVTIWTTARGLDPAPPEGTDEADRDQYQFRYAVERLVHDELHADLVEIGAFRSGLERRCHHTPELPTHPISGTAPGEIVTLTRWGEPIVRYRPDGTRLGELEPPAGALAPVGWMEASSDGHHLLFIEGDRPDRWTWTRDLVTGVDHARGRTWFNEMWDAGNEEIWALGVVPPNRTWAIGRVTADNSLDATTASVLGGSEEFVEFFGRRSDGRLLVLKSRTLEVIDPSSGRRSPLGGLKGCRDSFASWSPDGTRFAVSRTCSNDRRSGLYVGDSETGSTRLLLRGLTGTPRWSPDGRWVTVDADAALYSPRRARSLTVHDQVRDAQYVVRVDGSDAGQVAPVGQNLGRWIAPPTDPSRGGESSNRGTLAPNTRG